MVVFKLARLNFFRGDCTKCDSFFITKRDKCYYKVRQVLQSATIITKCDSTEIPPKFEN